MLHELPAITLATNDYNRLLFTAMMRQKHNHPSTDFLLKELRRAKACHPEDLIWPDAEISVTTPQGTARLGLRVGDSMSFSSKAAARTLYRTMEGTVITLRLEHRK